MMSLFSSFDFYYSKIPFLPFFILLYFLSNMFYRLSILSLSMEVSNLMAKFLFSLKPKSFTKMSLGFLLILMVSIFTLNFISVLPYNFALTSQFGVVLISSLSIWFSFMMIFFLKNFIGFLYHLVPEGCHVLLAVALFLIELVSMLIRPVTLSVRLVANIISGHILMILLSKLIFLYYFLFPLYILLNVVELFVSFIQSYIFCTLVSLYFSEVK